MMDRVTEEAVVERLKVGCQVNIRYFQLGHKRDVLLSGVYEGAASQNGGVAGREEGSYHRFIHRAIGGLPKIMSVAIGIWDLSLDLCLDIIDVNPPQVELKENTIYYDLLTQGWEKRNEMLRRFKL